MKVCRYSYFFFTKLHCSIQNVLTRMIVHIFCQFPINRTFLLRSIAHSTCYGCLQFRFCTHHNSVLWFYRIVLQEYFTILFTYSIYKYSLSSKTCRFCLQCKPTCILCTAYNHKCFSAKCFNLSCLTAC